MSSDRVRIGVVAPGSRCEPDLPGIIQAQAASLYGERVEVVFHPHCFEISGHFAGDDRARAEAFLSVANDERFDALWWGRGGYGACRIAEAVAAGLRPEAAGKAYMGYSDAGSLLAVLYGKGFGQVFHGPVANDVRREGGEAATERALSWLVDREPAALEPSVAPGGAPTAAFNLMILSELIGTPWQPNLTGHVLMVEEVGEYMYRIDRDFCHILANPQMRKIAGLRLGRCSGIPQNDPDFGLTEEEVARHWCERSGVAWLGRADIGHDVGNRVVPFGRL